MADRSNKPPSLRTAKLDWELENSGRAKRRRTGFGEEGSWRKMANYHVDDAGIRCVEFRRMNKLSGSGFDLTAAA